MTDDDKALVERLREGVLYGDARLHNPKGHDPLRMEAADRIEALSAKLAEAEALLELQNQDIGRLREALTQIARMRTDLSGDFSLGSKQSDIARAALGDTK